MRHVHKLVSLFAGCVLILTACTQTASVGIPTPSPLARETSQAIPTPTSGQQTVGEQPSATPLPPLPTDTAEAPQATATAGATQTTVISAEQTPTVMPQSATATAEATATEEPTAEPTAEPTDEPTATASASSSSSAVTCGRLVTYIVRPGDNLFRIALRYRTTIQAIARRNGLTNTRYIRSGTRLRILTCAR